MMHLVPNEHEWRKKTDNAGMRAVSGMTMSSNGFMYMVESCPAKAQIVAYDTQRAKRVIIEIEGMQQTNFDWQAVALGPHPDNPSVRCIIIADIGHSGVCNPQGAFRTKDQQTRLIYVKEPTKAELDGASVLSAEGHAFPIMYTSDNTPYHGCAMVYFGGSILIIARRTQDTHYVFSCPTAMSAKPTVLSHLSDMKVSGVTGAFGTPRFLVLATSDRLNFYETRDLNRHAKMVGCHRLKLAPDANVAIAYDRVESVIYRMEAGSSRLFSLQFDARAAWEQLTKTPPQSQVARRSKRTSRCRQAHSARVSTCDRTPSACSKGPQSKPSDASTRAPPTLSDSSTVSSGDPHISLWKSEFDLTGAIPHISGACFSADGRYIYVIEDAPRHTPLLYAFHASTLQRTIIDIYGIQPSGYNAARNAGFGDWTSLDIGVHPVSKAKCIIIADVGSNARSSDGQRIPRTADQPMRLLFVEEPTIYELSAGPSLFKEGTAFSIAYKPCDEAIMQTQAHALAVVDDRIFIITKCAKQTSYVFSCRCSELRTCQDTLLSPSGKMAILQSDVSDAFATSQHLVIRTYVDFNVYSVASLNKDKDAALLESTHLDMLDEGRQETMAYDAHTQCIYFFGQGSQKIHALEFNPHTRIAPARPEFVVPAAA